MPCASVDFEFRGKKFSVNGVNDNGTNKVEARALLEAMGFKVSWDDGKVVVE